MSLRSDKTPEGAQPGPEQPVLLEFDSVSHIFRDGKRGLESVSLAVRKGEFIVFAGRNGSGKTILMRHMNGLLKPSRGDVLYRGRPVSDDLAAVRRKIGLIFQNPDTQIVCSTVREEIAFGPENLRLPRGEIDRRVEAALSRFGLSRLAGRSTATLSGGEKRKLCIAAVAVMEPEILALDEPFIGLDRDGVTEVLGTVVDLHAAGTTVFLITHEIEKVLAHAGRLIVIDGGRIREDGPPAGLIGKLERYGIKNPQDAYTSWRDFTWLT
jgi:biotin transport system ATP-binding protein